MKCEIKRCRQDGAITFYKHQICEDCWQKHCEGKINLKEIFKIKEEQNGNK